MKNYKIISQEERSLNWKKASLLRDELKNDNLLLKKIIKENKKVLNTLNKEFRANKTFAKKVFKTDNKVENKNENIFDYALLVSKKENELLIR